MTACQLDGKDRGVGDFLVPPAVRPGDRVRVIAPSSPFDRALFFRGLGFLSERYRVEVAEGTLARSGFLAGTDETRLRALNAALAAKDVSAVIAARGGYGALRIAHRADWPALIAAPKWLVGFSDITALHLEAQRVGVCSIHGENAAGLGRADASTRESFIAALEGPATPRSFEQLTSYRSGSAEGPLCGGNLTVLFSVQAAGRLALPRGAILMLEDVTESSYRVDRMLTALIIAKALDQVAAVVCGDFTDCAPGPHSVPVEAVLRERLGELQIPVIAGLEFGHGPKNIPLPFGLQARVTASEGRLDIAI